MAVWHAKGRGTSPAFLLPLAKRLKTKRHCDKQLELHVFALAEGKLLKRAVVPGAPDKVFPMQSVSAGLLRVVKGGVECFGTKLRFDDK